MAAKDDGTGRVYAEISTFQSVVSHTERESHAIVGPVDVHFDEDSKTIYILTRDLLSKCVQMWTTDFNLIYRIGEGELNNPKCLTLCNGSVYVSECYPPRICKFTDGRFSDSSDQVNQPVGLAAENGELFVAEPGLKIISVFDSNFKQLRNIGKDKLKECHSIRVLNGIVYALELKLNVIVMFSTNGDYQGFLSTNNRSDPMRCFSFCIDKNQNFLIADYYHHFIKIVAIDGALIRVIKMLDFDCLLPSGIAVNDVGHILIVCKSGPHPLIVL